MPRMFFITVVALVAGASLLMISGADPAAVDEDRLWHHRNLGKAYYETPNMLPQAAEEFRKALELAPDSFRERLNYGLALVKSGNEKEGVAQLEKAQEQRPDVPHTWFNLGVAYKREGRSSEAIAQFERMIALVPSEPVSHYNLGLLYNRTGREQEALKQLRIAAQLDRNLVAPLYLMFNIHRAAGRKDEAQRALAEFQEVKREQKAADDSEDMDWSYYAEIYDPIDAEPAPEPPIPELEFDDHKLPGAVDAKTAELLSMDVDGDHRPDLVVWSRSGIRVYKDGTAEIKAGVEGLRDVVDLAAGDFDNDGLADLCIVTAAETKLFHNDRSRFFPVRNPQPPAPAVKALWLDYDHDYDLDLFLFGQQSVVLRNEGTAGFRPVSFPFERGRAVDAAAFRLIADAKGTDIVVSHADRTGVLYRDLLRGHFEAVRLAVLPAGVRSLQAIDSDNDGWMDVAYAGGMLRNVAGKLEHAPSSSAGGYVFADVANRGVADLIAGGTVYGNGSERQLGLKALSWTSADFDQDGRADLAGIASDGSVHLLMNRTQTSNHWMRVRLEGVKNPKLASGSEIEIKAGARYQKRAYGGVPLVFGLGTYREADTVRITWPNGMIQNLAKQRAGDVVVTEAPRLSGSCPMIFTWNGSEFEFITDVLGVAPLGASAGDGSYFPVDHDEYVQIPEQALKAVNGRYQVRITEELREVSYIDEVKLIAVDHPEGLEILTNEKFKSPPFPDFRLFGVRERIHPAAAFDERGRDVSNAVRERDRVYADTFRRNYAGAAEMHSLTLDFGAADPHNPAVLVLNGWVDWADGSTFAGAAQQGGGLVLPYLQVRGETGEWRTVIEDMGIPAGKPKTIVIDLKGRFLSRSREVRIVTNLCVYWDEIYLSENTTAPQVRLAPLSAEAAQLHFRGFSRAIIHPERKQPERFDYSHVQPSSMWNQTEGLFTRYGAVDELLETADDRFVIMGSGDELALSFPAAALPPLAAGWTRDFLLKVDGWAKDGDANTAFSESVEPLPFHTMSKYPYPETERYPDGGSHTEYRQRYNTRPALRLMRPLR